MLKQIFHLYLYILLNVYYLIICSLLAFMLSYKKSSLRNV